MENYRLLVEREPDNAEYHYRIAKIHYARQEYRKTVETVKKAILLSPNRAEFRLLAGKGYYQKQDYFNAIGQLTSAIALDEESLSARYHLALCYERVGKTEKAIEQLKLAIALEPLYFDAHLTLVSIQFKRGSPNRDYDRPIAQLENALLINPTSIPGNILLSELYYAAGESRKATAILETHIATNGDSDDVLNALAHMEYRSGRYRKAAETIRRISTKNLAVQLLNLKIGYELSPESNLKPEIENLIAAHPNNGPLHLFDGILEYRLGNLDRAERSFQSALRIDPSDGMAFFRLSQIWRDRNDFVGSENSLKRALKLEPHNPEIFASYLRLLIEQGNWERAARLLNDRETSNQNFEMLYIRGLIAKNRRLYHEAESLFRQSQQKRFSAEVETQLADIEIAQGRYRAAEKRLRLAQKTEPHHIETALTLAKLLFATQKTDQIPPLLTPYLSNGRGKGRVHLQLAEAWIQLSRIEKATTVLAEGLESWPRHPELAQMLTLHLGLKGEYEKAIRILEDMQTFDHKYHRLFHYRLSGYYHKTENGERFRAYLLRYNRKQGLEP